jgi:cation:H+ antiporter
MLPVVLLAAGFALLLVGGESLVRGSVGAARRLGVSPLVIGLTLVGFGTSTPELLTSVQAALAGSPGIAVGNVVGSNIANILLILGIAAVLRPIACQPAAFYRDGSVLAASAVLITGMALTGSIGRVSGGVLVALLAAYLVYTYRTEQRRPEAPPAARHAREAEAAEPPPGPLWRNLLFAAGGIALTVLGARLLVDGAIQLAREAGVSEAVIGLTVVAVGTSLPELVTSIVAAIKREGDVAFGNVVGSNIYNVLGILGVTALVRPLGVPAEILAFDLWVMLGVTALLIVFAVTGWRLVRWEGAVFLAGYAGYVSVLAATAL